MREARGMACAQCREIPHSLRDRILVHDMSTVNKDSRKASWSKSELTSTVPTTTHFHSVFDFFTPTPSKNAALSTATQAVNTTFSHSFGFHMRGSSPRTLVRVNSR